MRRFLVLAFLLIQGICYAQTNVFNDIKVKPRTTTPALTDGVIWYDDTDGKFKVRQEGLTLDMVGGAGLFWALTGTSTLTGNTTIDMDGFNLSLNSGDPATFYNINIGTTDAGGFQLFNNAAVISVDQAGVNSEVINLESGKVELTYTNQSTSDNTFFRVQDGNINLLSDDPTFPGATYDIDYSANFTNRSLVDKAYVDGLVAGPFYTEAEADQRFASESTGLLEGGTLSINGGDNTKFDIAAGKSIFVDITSSVETPTVTPLNWSTKSAITVTNIATQPVTYIGINSSDIVVQQATPFTDTQRRTIVQLGLIVHSNNVIVNAVNNFPAMLNHPISQLHDFMNAVGILNLTGNVYSANGANLNVNKTSGTIFKLGANQTISNLAPNTVSLASGTAITFRYRRQNSAEGSDVTSVDPDNYDVGGTLTAVPTNKWTVQRINVFQSNLTRFQYGQTVYDSKADAVAGVATEAFVTETNIKDNGLLRGYLIIRQGSTSLTSADNLFLEAAKFGSSAIGSGAASSTLQVAYNNSVVPQILTSIGLGAVTIRRGSAADTDNVFAIQNNAGTDTYTIKGNGGRVSTVNSSLQNTVTGTWTATANNDHHANFTGSFSARAVASDNIFAYRFTPTLTANSTTQSGFGVEISPTFVVGSGTFTNAMALRVVGKTTIANSAINGGGQLSVFGPGTTTGTAFLVGNSGAATRFSVLDNGVCSFTAITGNSFTFTSTQSAAANNEYGLMLLGTLTGRSTANESYTNIAVSRGISTGGTGQSMNVFQVAGAQTFNHANGILRGFYHNPTLSGSQLASLTNLAFHGVSGSLLLGGTTITTGSVLADFQSTTLGLIFPRVTNTAAIATPVLGMKAYDAATNLFIEYEGAGAWQNPAYLTKTQTLTNKTLTAPQLNSAKLETSSTVGYVWTATNTTGDGSWQAATGSIVGNTGSLDNAVLRADGTGGSTVQTSFMVLDDNTNLTLGTTGLAGSQRSITAQGSASDVQLQLVGKGTSGVGIFPSGSLTALFSDDDFEQRKDAASTNTVLNMMRFVRTSSGTPSAGIGVSFNYEIETAAGHNEIGARLDVVTTDVTNNSEDFDWVFNNMAGGFTVTERFRITSLGGVNVNRTITAGGVTGNQTIDKVSGTVNFAASATTLTVTNSLVTSTSIVLAVVRTDDSTALIKNVVCSSGSFVITLNAAATAETSVGFFVLN